jgi:hypothetical protein
VGFPPVKISFGEEDPDTGTDTALTMGGMQRVYDMAYVAALFVSDRLENSNMRGGRYKYLGCFKYDLFHCSSW